MVKTKINIGTNYKNFQEVEINKPFGKIKLSDIYRALEKEYSYEYLKDIRIIGWCETPKKKKKQELKVEITNIILDGVMEYHEHEAVTDKITSLVWELIKHYQNKKEKQVTTRDKLYEAIEDLVINTICHGQDEDETAQGIMAIVNGIINKLNN